MVASGDASPGGDGIDQHQSLSNAIRRLHLEDQDIARRALDEIAALASAGHQPALRVLLQEILGRGLASRPIRRVLLDPADVADAEQMTLIVVAERISSFESRARFTTWLETVARNEALMLLRRRQRKSEPISNELPESDRFARRLSSLVASEHELQQALEQLSPEHRTVVHLRENVGLSYEDIATELGVPVGTVRSRINRARQALAALLIDST